MLCIEVICTPNECSTIRDYTFFRVELDVSYDRQDMPPNTCCSLFAVCRFASLHAKLENQRSYKDLLNRLLFYERYLFSGLKLFATYKGRVSILSTAFRLFRLYILGALTLITWKLQVVYRHYTYRTSALLLALSNFFVRSKCEIQLGSLRLKYASQSFSDKPFVYTYMIFWVCHQKRSPIINGAPGPVLILKTVLLNPKL